MNNQPPFDENDLDNLGIQKEVDPFGDDTEEIETPEDLTEKPFDDEDLEDAA